MRHIASKQDWGALDGALLGRFPTVIVNFAHFEPLWLKVCHSLRAPTGLTKQHLCIQEGRLTDFSFKFRIPVAHPIRVTGDDGENQWVSSYYFTKCSSAPVLSCWTQLFLDRMLLAEPCDPAQKEYQGCEKHYLYSNSLHTSLWTESSHALFVSQYVLTTPAICL